MPTTLPLDQIYDYLRQPTTPKVSASIYAQQVEQVQTTSITTDWFKQVAGQLNEFSQVKQQQEAAYAKRSAAIAQEAQQQAEQQRLAQETVSITEQENLARADQLSRSQAWLQQYTQEADNSLPTETPADEALVEEASGNGGFFSGLKDIGAGAVGIAKGVTGLVGGPIKELAETPFEVGRELVTGGGLQGVKRELHEGIAPLYEPAEATFEIAREAIRGDLGGLMRELKEAGQEIPQASSLITAWDGMNRMFLGEQKIITPLTRPIIRETLQMFRVPEGISETIAKYAAEVLVPTTFIPIAGQLGKTKGAAKLLKAALAEGSINLLQNRAGRKERGEEEPGIIEDATMFTFGFGGRIGMEYAARALSKFVSKHGGLKNTVKSLVGKGDDAPTSTKYYHATDPASRESIDANGFRPGETQHITTDPDLAYQFALRKSDNPVVMEVQVREGAELGGKDALRTVNAEDLTVVRTLDPDEVVPLGAAKPKEEMLSLEHYSAEKLDEIDPSFAGTGKAGAEAGFGGPRVSHYYLSGTKPERMIVNLPNKMTVEVPKSEVLDLVSEEGIDLVARAKALKAEQGPVAAHMGDTRQLAKDEGWKGIYNSEDPLKRVQLFDTAQVLPDAAPTNFTRAVQATKGSDRGGTFDPRTGDSISPEGQHFVGGGVPTKTIPMEEFNEEALHAFVRENAEVFEDPAMKVGTEVVDDASGRQVVNIDATTPIRDRGEALELAKARGQERIWDGSASANIEVAGVKQTQTPITDTAAPKTGRVSNEDIRVQATEYAEQANLTLADLPYAKVDQPRAKRIADAYEAAEHTPNDPAVKRAYDAFKQETHEQWEFLKNKGVKFDAWTKEGQPYKNSAEMRADIADNNHLSFFKGGELPADHPMAAKAPGDSGLTSNDEFRAIHDYFGHAKEGFEFGPRGEENAWRTHSQMFSDEARKALTTETRGQNSWVNYGPNGKANRADPSKTVFPDQKATLLPDEFTKLDDAAPTVRPESKAGGADESLEAAKPPDDMASALDTPTTTKPAVKAVDGDEVTNKLADFTPEEKAVVRTIVTSKKAQVGSAAHSFIAHSKTVIVKVYNAIKKMGRTFHEDEVGALRFGKKTEINKVTYADMMNIGASRRWLHPQETWKEWADWMTTRIGSSRNFWLTNAKQDIRDYTTHQMGLLGSGPVGGGVKKGDILSARYGPSAHPRTYDEFLELVESGSRLQSTTGEIVDMREWYDEFMTWMTKNFGDDAEIMTMFAAVTQANASPAAGITHALNAFTAWKLGQPITGMGSASIRKSIELIIRGGVPTGPKINPFWQALASIGKRGRNSVAIDRWMLAAIGAQEGRWKNLASNKRFIRFAQQLITEAATEADLDPRAFQAAMWGGVKFDWNKIRVAAGLRKGGADYSTFEDLFEKKMSQYELRAPSTMRKLAEQNRLFDESELERYAIEALEQVKPGESRAARGKRLNELVLAQWNEKMSAGHLLETGEIPSHVTSTEARERVTHSAAMYKRDLIDRLNGTDTKVLENMLNPRKIKGQPKQPSHLPKWQQTLAEETLEARKASAQLPTENLKTLPKAERARLKELGYDHVPQTTNDLKLLQAEMKSLDEATNRPKITAWLKRNKAVVGDHQKYVGKSLPTGVKRQTPMGIMEKHEMSPYWEPKNYFENEYVLNIPKIQSAVRALYPDQRLIDGTKQTIGDALKIANKNSPVGACA